MCVDWWNGWLPAALLHCRDSGNYGRSIDFMGFQKRICRLWWNYRWNCDKLCLLPYQKRKFYFLFWSCDACSFHGTGIWAYWMFLCRLLLWKRAACVVWHYLYAFWFCTKRCKPDSDAADLFRRWFSDLRRITVVCI